MEDHYTEASDLCLYTDASGAHFHGHWFRGDWTLGQKLVTDNDTTIAYQELVLAASVWGHAWSQKRILFFCDNDRGHCN